MSHTVTLKSSGVCVVDGVGVPLNGTGHEMLVELYRAHIGDYPKFHKMDPLCKAGFVASEQLLAAECPGPVEQRPCFGGADRAVLLFSRSGSIAADSAYQETIQQPDNFFPSPALFVYTLPNILTGEIAIRNRYYGETNCILLPGPDPRAMDALIQATMNNGAESVLTGWVECSGPDHYDISLKLLDKSDINP